MSPAAVKLAQELLLLLLLVLFSELIICVT